MGAPLVTMLGQQHTSGLSHTIQDIDLKILPELKIYRFPPAISDTLNQVSRGGAWKRSV